MTLNASISSVEWCFFARYGRKVDFSRRFGTGEESGTRNLGSVKSDLTYINITKTMVRKSIDDQFLFPNFLGRPIDFKPKNILIKAKIALHSVRTRGYISLKAYYD